MTHFSRTLALLLVVPGFSIQIASAQKEGPEPFGGLKSVADRASEAWESAHGELRKTMADATDPCNPARRAALDSAKKALAEKTRAWKAFYQERGTDAKLTREAAAKNQVDNDAGIRTEQDNQAKAEQMVADLKKKRDNLKTSDPEGGKLASAIADLEEMINVHTQIISASQQTADHMREISTVSSTEVSEANAEVERAAAYELLIDQGDRLYQSFYRARELRMGLECRAPRVPPPPPLRVP